MENLVLKCLLEKTEVRGAVNVLRSWEDGFASSERIGCLDRTGSFSWGPRAVGSSYMLSASLYYSRAASGQAHILPTKSPRTPWGPAAAVGLWRRMECWSLGTSLERTQELTCTAKWSRGGLDGWGSNIRVIPYCMTSGVPVSPAGGWREILWN